MSKEAVLAAYRPHLGKEKELVALIGRHVPTLRELELITSRESMLLRAQDGTYVEIFEWVDGNAAARAHEHPAVAAIWEKMAGVCDFVSVSQIAEAQKPFSHYEVVDL